MYRKAQSTKTEFVKDLQCLTDSNTEAEKKTFSKTATEKLSNNSVQEIQFKWNIVRYTADHPHRWQLLLSNITLHGRNANLWILEKNYQKLS